jgi:hypothetical protein
MVEMVTFTLCYVDTYVEWFSGMSFTYIFHRLSLSPSSFSGGAAAQEEESQERVHALY